MSLKRIWNFLDSIVVTIMWAWSMQHSGAFYDTRSAFRARGCTAKFLAVLMLREELGVGRGGLAMEAGVATTHVLRNHCTEMLVVVIVDYSDIAVVEVDHVVASRRRRLIAFKSWRRGANARFIL